MTSKRVDTNPAQLSFLETLMKQREERLSESCEGSHNVQSRLRCALIFAIEYARPLSRFEIAGRMSHLLGRDITKHMIDTWTAESKDLHRIPAEYLPALCAATGCNRPLEVLNDAAGIYTVPGPDALRAEIQKLDEQARKIQGEKKRRQIFLQELEAK